MQKRFSFGRFLIYTTLIVGSLVMAYPLVYALAGSFLLSFIISRIVLIRYRSIQNNMIAASDYNLPSLTKETRFVQRTGKKEPSIHKKGDYITIELSDERSLDNDAYTYKRARNLDPEVEHSRDYTKKKVTIPVMYEEDTAPGKVKEIKDAIPLAKKR